MPPHACRNCGAPLPLGANPGIIVCRYCNTSNDTRAPAKGFAPPRPPPGLNLPPRPQLFVPPPEPMPVVKTGGAGRVLALVMGMFAVVAVMGGGLFASLLRSTTSAVAGGGTGLGGVKAALANEHWGSGGCLVDADGDAVLDVVGLSGGVSGRHTPTIVNGATGEVRWRGQTGNDKTKVLCAGRNHFLVTGGDFSARLITARSPSQERVVQLRDEAQSATLGNGCVSVRTSDGSSMGIQLATGATGACEVADNPWRREPGMIGLTDRQTEITSGKRRYTLTQRESGTPILTLSASEGGKTLWTQETRYRKATFASAVAPAGGTVVVFGARLADDKKGMLIGFDAATGAERYAVELSGVSTWKVEMLQFNGQYVIASYWTGLYAFNPVNGKVAWSLGG
ncbi:MAG: PQQ-binding-like beta-propeller repeat protein [Polyangiaceae bacterium]|nr:PQQ-binding-like beta-propeller repeat protein [Polyangiaceae bacterium]MCW5790534.1 PQQ-binding-like beta-propeller repeat protein [Polyangiaceae bacterium]